MISVNSLPTGGWSGQQKSEVRWKDGKHNGLTTTWNENGKKTLEGTFKDRVKVED